MAYYNNAAKDDNFKTFTQDLKAERLPNILLIYGQEQFLMEWAFEHLTKKYVASGWESIDAVSLYDDADAKEILENLKTMSMLSTRRIIWVKEYRHLLGEKTRGYSREDLERFVKELNSYDGDNIIIFSYENLDKTGPHLKYLDASKVRKYNFDKLTQTALKSFINKRFKAGHVNISRNDLNLIIELSGYYNKESEYRLYNLVNDINKIISLSEGNAIREQDIMLAMNGDMDTYIFDFIEALSAAKRETAFVILNNILKNGTNIYQVMSTIISQFELMVQIKEMSQEGSTLAEITKDLKMHEFRIKKAMQATNKFDLKKLKSLLLSAYESDINIKLGNLEQTTALELLIARV